MKDVTISLDDDTARWIRIEADRRDKSLSRFVAEVLRELMAGAGSYETAHQSFLSRGPFPLGEAGLPYPGRDVLHQR